MAKHSGWAVASATKQYDVSWATYLKRIFSPRSSHSLVTSASTTTMRRVSFWVIPVRVKYPTSVFCACEMVSFVVAVTGSENVSFGIVAVANFGVVTTISVAATSPKMYFWP